MMDKTKIKGILDQKELSVYDCGKLFTEIGNALQAFEHSITIHLEYVTEDAETMIEKAKETLAHIDSYYDRIEATATKLFQKSEYVVIQARNNHTKVKEAIDALPVFGEVSVPYDLSKLIDIAERCNHLSEPQWQRVIDLAKALSVKVEVEDSQEN